MREALIIGGSRGIGLNVALQLADIYSKITIIDKSKPTINLPENIEYEYHDLTLTDFAWLKKFDNCNFLFYSAGFGRVSEFINLKQKEIENLFQVNVIAFFKILNYFIPKIQSKENFYCGGMVSIAGRIASPLFSVYSATKAALFRGIEAINTELKMRGIENRILEISPGSLKGTSFNGGVTDISQNSNLAKRIIKSMFSHETLLIPDYETIYAKVLNRYNKDPEEFATESYKYKIDNNRIQNRPHLTVGYLSGTFDLFHIGHLNLIKRARQYCDYLVVGVHRDGSHKGKEVFIPYEERVEILKSLKYVDKVIESEKEDSDIYTKDILKYDILFVGSDYKGTERFNKYEEYFKDKGVKIIYFPYTKGTSSTQLRAALIQK